MKQRIRASVIVLSASAFLSAGAVASAAVIARPMPVVRAVPLVAPRIDPVVGMRPLVSAVSIRPRAGVVAPLKPLPLPAWPMPRALASLTPFAFASVLPAALDLARCPRPTTFVVAALPATPFEPLVCSSDWSGDEAFDELSPLVPGHNKDALYGLGYTPHDFGSP